MKILLSVIVVLVAVCLIMWNMYDVKIDELETELKRMKEVEKVLSEDEQKSRINYYRAVEINARLVNENRMLKATNEMLKEMKTIVVD